MKKLLIFLVYIFLISFDHAFATVRLFALTKPGNPIVTLRWNMVNYPGNTTYSLFRSEDGVVWTIAAANSVFIKYTSSSILEYKDDFSNEEKYYYRVKVYDTNENIVEISNTALVENPKNLRSENEPSKTKKFENRKVPSGGIKRSWQIAPNPVGDKLNLYYKGYDIIQGVINVIIQNTTGKIVLKYRASSKNKEIQIPVSQLNSGVYFIQIRVRDEAQLNEKFIKR
jgi:hypothetical protein